MLPGNFEAFSKCYRSHFPCKELKQDGQVLFRLALALVIGKGCWQTALLTGDCQGLDLSSQ